MMRNQSFDFDKDKKLNAKLRMYYDKKEFMNQNSDYRMFLKKSLEVFRTESNSKVESYNIKVPEIIRVNDQKTEKHRRLRDEILKKSKEYNLKELRKIKKPNPFQISTT